MRQYVFIASVALIALSSWYYSYQLFRGNEATILDQLANAVEIAAVSYQIAALSALDPDAHLLMPITTLDPENVKDTWKAARSEGRTHEGTDIFAARNTPVYAATDGYVIKTGNNRLGGIFVMIVGAGGRRYYYAHLNSIAPDIKNRQRVTTETVLGYVGNTGNARGVAPHLHLGVYTRTGVAINPYPFLAKR